MAATETPAPGTTTALDVDGWRITAEVYTSHDAENPSNGNVLITIEIPGEDTSLTAEITPAQWVELTALPVPGA